MRTEEQYSICPVGAIPGGEAYLLLTEGKRALIDTGYSFCAGQMAENVKEQLNGKPLDYVILTQYFGKNLRSFGSVKSLIHSPVSFPRFHCPGDTSNTRLKHAP